MFLRSRNLKYLDIFGEFTPYIGNAFIKCQNLETLSVFWYKDSPSTADALKAILKANSGIEVLQIEGISVFSEDFLSEINFKLREFSIDTKANNQQLQNLILFLETQSDTLEILSLPNCSDIIYAVMKNVLPMRRLRKLTFGRNDTDQIAHRWMIKMPLKFRKNC